MIQEKRYIFSRVNMLIDLALGAVAFFLAHLVRNYLISPWIAESAPSGPDDLLFLASFPHACSIAHFPLLSPLLRNSASSEPLAKCLEDYSELPGSRTLKYGAHLHAQGKRRQPRSDNPHPELFDYPPLF